MQKIEKYVKFLLKFKKVDIENPRVCFFSKIDINVSILPSKGTFLTFQGPLMIAFYCNIHSLTVLYYKNTFFITSVTFFNVFSHFYIF